MFKKIINAIVVPGLGGHYNLYECAVNVWHLQDINPTVFHIHWEDGIDYETKVIELSKLIEQKLAEKKPLILVGVSAGASAVLNASINYQKLNGIVTICGFINLKYLDKKQMDMRSPAFTQSLVKLSGNLKKLDRSKVLSLTSYNDTVVVPEASKLEGATFKKIAAFGHVVGIAVALLFYANTIKKADSRKEIILA